MNELLWQTYHRLIAEVDTKHVRFLYQQLNLEHRLTGISGPRGVGKTTLLTAVNTFLSTNLDIGTKRELAFLQFLTRANIKAFYPQQGDFQVTDIIFEVGRKINLLNN